MYTISYSDWRRNMNRFSAKTKSLLFRSAFVFIFLICAISAVSLTAGASGGIRYRSYTSSKPSSLGYSSTSFSVQSRSDSSSVLRKGSLPSSYSSVKQNLVTPVKDQGYYGTCWAFATVSVAETSIIKEFEEYNINNCDFSEAHISYFSVSDATDSLNLTVGDKARLNRTNFLDLGGNLYFATFTLSKWFGLADESVAPYKKATANTKYPNTLAYSDNKMILENSLWVSMEDRDSIKSLIMKYGSCAVSYYHDERNLSTNTGAYYQSVSKKIPNHSVTIVGWNDNYSKNNFGTLWNLYAKPNSNGAWLIKNSYGTSFGKGGYMWLSYEDSSLLYDDAAFLDFTKPSTFDKNYQYDGTTCSFGGYYSKDLIMGANRFKALSSDDLLTGISFYTAEPDVACYYQIYKNVTGTSNPTNGQAVYSSPVKCYQKYAGYHTVYLPAPVELKKGEYFSVVITYINKGKEVTVLTDDVGYVDSTGYIYNYASSLKGQSFISEDGKTWDDLYKIGDGENIRIKAFTKTRSAKPKKVSLSSSLLYTLPNRSVKLSASVSPYYAVNKLIWKSSDPETVSVSADGTVTAKKYGTATITCYSAADNSVHASAKVCVILPNVTGLKTVKSSCHAVSVSWNKHAQADYYEIYLLDSKTKKKVLTATVKTTSYLFTNLNPGENLICCVAAVSNSTGRIIKSGYGTALITGTRPNPVSKVKAAAITSNAVKLFWSKAEGADFYYIYAYNAKTKKYTYLQKASGTSAVVSKLKANTDYIFAVTAISVSGKTNIKAPAFPVIKIRTAPMNVPKFTAKKISSGKVSLSWTKSAGASGYQIFRYNPKTKAYVGVKATTASSLTVSKLTAGQIYTFRIRAYSVYNNTKLYSGYTYVKVKA